MRIEKELNCSGLAFPSGGEEDYEDDISGDDDENSQNDEIEEQSGSCEQSTPRGHTVNLA
jgi:hypothetical protein